MSFYALKDGMSTDEWNSFEGEGVAPKQDAVHHPAHYCKGGVECIAAIKASMSKEAFAGYCKGNALKYLWRYEDKGGVESLRKALVYLNWLIETEEAKA